MAGIQQNPGLMQQPGTQQPLMQGQYQQPQYQQPQYQQPMQMQPGMQPMMQAPPPQMVFMNMGTKLHGDDFQHQKEEYA